MTAAPVPPPMGPEFRVMPPLVPLPYGPPPVSVTLPPDAEDEPPLAFPPLIVTAPPAAAPVPAFAEDAAIAMELPATEAPLTALVGTVILKVALLPPKTTPATVRLLL